MRRAAGCRSWYRTGSAFGRGRCFEKRAEKLLGLTLLQCEGVVDRGAVTIEEALEGEAANGRGHQDDGKARGAAIGQAHLLEFIPEQLPIDELAGSGDRQSTRLKYSS